MTLGCQTYPVRGMLAADFPGTLQQLGDAGFQTIELCSPVGYAHEGFAGLAKYTGVELRKIIEDHGLKCESSHYMIRELRENLADRIAWSHAVGITQMIVPTLAGPANPTMDHVKRAADEYNEIARRSAAEGVHAGLHNEGFEHSTVDGRRTYDVLFELLDPELVKFQFQVSAISEGFDAADYFTRYPGRFYSMHVQDWSSETRKIMPVGEGTLDWKKIFTAAKTGGVKIYFVEMKLDMMRASVPYLRQMGV